MANDGGIPAIDVGETFGTETGVRTSRTPKLQRALSINGLNRNAAWIGVVRIYAGALSAPNR
jgi:hypothetical protein